MEVQQDDAQQVKKDILPLNMLSFNCGMNYE